MISDGSGVPTTGTGAAAPLRRRSVSRILWRIIVVGSVLFTGGSAVQTGLTALLIRCGDDKADLPSPDGKHIAHRWVHSCEGPTMFSESFRQVMSISRAGDDGMAGVFESQRYDGKMRWEDSDHLRIDIESPGPVELSLHQGYSVHVAYHVPRPLILLGVQSQDDQERQTEEAHRAGKISDADYESRKKSDRWVRLGNERFIQWAAENAIIDDEPDPLYIGGLATPKQK